MYKIRSLVVTCWIILLFIFDSFGFSNFTNYQSVIRVNGIVASKGKIWAASSGGLFCIDRDNNNTQTLYSDEYCFPDLNLTALAQDSKGNLWIGTKLGYLYKRPPDGACSVYDSYIGSQWDITDLQMYNDYVIVSSSKGLSIFDPQKGLAIRNTTATDTTRDPMVYATAVHGDSLYVGGTKSYNAVNISGNRFLDNNYLDLSIWKSTVSEKPIVCFIDSLGRFLPKGAPSAYDGSVLFHCINSIDSFFLYADTNMIFSIRGKITKMIVDSERNLWFGTDQNFFYCRTSTGIVQYKIPGLTFNAVVRIYTARNGNVWLLSNASDNTWWEGISKFDGKNWHLFNQYTVDNFGPLGGAGGSNFRGICEDRNGNFWFGTPGSSVKYYDVQKNQWIMYYVAGYAGDTAIRQGGGWGAHEAVAQDSSGYMWFSNYTPGFQITSGPLVCYDASNRQSPNYRRFFPEKTIHNATNITSLCVDSGGKILAAADDRLLIVRHDGSPITDGLTVEMDKNDMGVLDICSAPAGATWIATGKGLYRYGRSDGSLALNSTVQTAITCVEAEDERVLWLGTSNAGLIRYDLLKDVKTVLDRSNGLVSNAVNDLSIDKKGGYLWVATAEGVSRYYLGHSDAPVAGNASIVASPNPFSKSNPNHRRIIFKHCAADARVLIYAMNGALVKQLSRESNSFITFDDNTFESTLFWVPPRNLAPGAYFFIGYPQKPATTKKLFIVP
jgi:ligand-binding sensor domain-containing protein